MCEMQLLVCVLLLSSVLSEVQPLVCVLLPRFKSVLLLVSVVHVYVLLLSTHVCALPPPIAGALLLSAICVVRV